MKTLIKIDPKIEYVYRIMAGRRDTDTYSKYFHHVQAIKFIDDFRVPENTQNFEFDEEFAWIKISN